MSRLLVHVEGQTEETFVNELLRPHLASLGWSMVSARLIDDSPRTAPSKRVEHLVRGYEKPLFGPLAALEIGLPTIRRECPHFGNWLERLEQLPGSLA